MHFTVEAQRIAAEFLAEGAIAIDATAGNGFDTLFLANRVGASGVVYAFDIQQTAIDSLQAKLSSLDYGSRCHLMCRSHAELDTVLLPSHRGLVSVAMLNLGYLPFGDKSIITTVESTISALNAIHRVLKPGGLMTVIAYPGHPGGRREMESVANWIRDQEINYRMNRYQDSFNQKSPVLWTMKRKVVD